MVILRKPNLQLTAPVTTFPLWLVCLLTAGMLAACTGSGDNHYRPTFAIAAGNKHEIIFGAPSLAYFETTDLVVKYLNAHLDSIRIRTVACTSVEDFEDKLRKGFFDFTVINGPQLITATQNGYTVAGRIADDYHSLLFVNKDSGIEKIPDCKGHTIALTGNRILAGSMMPLMYLYQHGIDVNKDIKRLYSPSYESVLLDVCLGKCAIGAVWSTSYANFQRKSPDLAAHLEVKWTTPSLPSSGILFKRSLNKDIAKKIATLLIRLQTDQQGRKALGHVGIGSFEAADSTTYFPLTQFLRKYDSLIH